MSTETSGGDIFSPHFPGGTRKPYILLPEQPDYLGFDPFTLGKDCEAKIRKLAKAREYTRNMRNVVHRFGRTRICHKKVSASAGQESNWMWELIEREMRPQRREWESFLSSKWTSRPIWSNSSDPVSVLVKNRRSEFVLDLFFTNAVVPNTGEDHNIPEAVKGVNDLYSTRCREIGELMKTSTKKLGSPTGDKKADNLGSEACKHLEKLYNHAKKLMEDLSRQAEQFVKDIYREPERHSALISLVSLVAEAVEGAQAVQTPEGASPSVRHKIPEAQSEVAVCMNSLYKKVEECMDSLCTEVEKAKKSTEQEKLIDNLGKKVDQHIEDLTKQAEKFINDLCVEPVRILKDLYMEARNPDETPGKAPSMLLDVDWFAAPLLDVWERIMATDTDIKDDDVVKRIEYDFSIWLFEFTTLLTQAVSQSRCEQRSTPSITEYLMIMKEDQVETKTVLEPGKCAVAAELCEHAFKGMQLLNRCQILITFWGIKTMNEEVARLLAVQQSCKSALEENEHEILNCLGLVVMNWLCHIKDTLELPSKHLSRIEGDDQLSEKDLTHHYLMDFLEYLVEKRGTFPPQPPGSGDKKESWTLMSLMTASEMEAILIVYYYLRPKQVNQVPANTSSKIKGDQLKQARPESDEPAPKLWWISMWNFTSWIRRLGRSDVLVATCKTNVLTDWIKEQLEPESNLGDLLVSTDFLLLFEPLEYGVCELLDEFSKRAAEEIFKNPQCGASLLRTKSYCLAGVHYEISHILSLDLEFLFTKELKTLREEVLNFDPFEIDPQSKRTSYDDFRREKMRLVMKHRELSMLGAHISDIDVLWSSQNLAEATPLKWVADIPQYLFDFATLSFYAGQVVEDKVRTCVLDADNLFCLVKLINPRDRAELGKLFPFFASGLNDVELAKQDLQVPSSSEDEKINEIIKRWSKIGNCLCLALQLDIACELAFTQACHGFETFLWQVYNEIGKTLEKREDTKEDGPNTEKRLKLINRLHDKKVNGEWKEELAGNGFEAFLVAVLTHFKLWDRYLVGAKIMEDRERLNDTANLCTVTDLGKTGWAETLENSEAAGRINLNYEMCEYFHMLLEKSNVD